MDPARDEVNQLVNSRAVVNQLVNYGELLLTGQTDKASEVLQGINKTISIISLQHISEQTSKIFEEIKSSLDSIIDNNVVHKRVKEEDQDLINRIAKNVEICLNPKPKATWKQSTPVRNPVPEENKLLVEYFLKERINKQLAKQLEKHKQIGKEKFEEAENLFFGINKKDIDFNSAIRLYKEAADGGYTEAQNKLGELYNKGYMPLQPNENPIKTAFTYFKKAAKHHNPKAMYNLYRLNRETPFESDLGENLIKYLKKVAKILEASSEKDPGSLYYLSLCYRSLANQYLDSAEGIKNRNQTGENKTIKLIEKYKIKAEKYSKMGEQNLNMAVSRNDREAQYELGFHCYVRMKQYLESNETEAEADYGCQAFDWLKKSEEQGHHGAKYLLSELWGGGHYESRNEKPKTYEEKSLALEDRFAEYFQPDHEKANELLLEASKQNNLDAKFAIALGLYEGRLQLNDPNVEETKKCVVEYLKEIISNYEINTELGDAAIQTLKKIEEGNFPSINPTMQDGVI